MLPSAARRAFSCQLPLIVSDVRECPIKGEMEGFMKIVRNLFGLGLLVVASGAVLTAQDPPPATEKPDEQPAPAQPELPPRVVGEVRTLEEKSAWEAVTGAPESEKVAKAQEFLTAYEDSGMTPHAHYVIAMTSFRNADYVNFTMHGEMALEELPEAVDLLSQLAYYYAEKKKYDESIQHAETLIFLMDGMGNPGKLSDRDWAQGQDQVAATANYALGRSHLGKYIDDKTKPENLDQAIENLETALTFNPVDDYVYFRLGEAYLLKERRKDATASYARAAAAQGPVAGQARVRLKSLVGEDKVNDAIAKEFSYLQKQLQAKQSGYLKLSADPPPQG